MRDLLNLALLVIVWIGLVLIIRLMENVLKKIALPILQKTVPEPWLVKMLVVMTANNVVLIVAHPVLNLIQVLMPQQLNAAIRAIIATLLVLLVLLLLIPELLVLKTNVVSLVKNVQQLVLPVA